MGSDARGPGPGFGGSKGELARVQKRDGRVVPFQTEKIQAAIAAALAAEGQPDPAFAGEVASVVELTLSEQMRHRRKQGGAMPVPSIEDIQDLVEQALMELGHPQVAKSYILYRDRRARSRKALRVHRSDSLRSPVRVREREGVSQWSKGRLIGALITEAEMPREAAAEIASSVERRVFASGLTHITTGLIRELVAGELLERGWVQAHHSLGALGLSRHDISKLLAGRPLDAWDEAHETTYRAGFAASGALLRKFAMEDIVPDGVGELHRAGDMHIEDLRAPQLPLSMCLDAELLASGGNSVLSAQAVLEGVAELSSHVSQVLVLEHPANVLAPLLRAARPQSPLGLGGWLRALGAVARAANIRVDLGSPGSRFTNFTPRLIEALVELVPGPHTPRLYLEGHELESVLNENPELVGAVDRLLGEGRLFSTWGEEDEMFVGPGCHRKRREPGVVSCGGAIALNLPRLARRAGAWREDLVQGGLAELVQAALEVAGSLEEFQSKSDGGRAAGLHVRSSWAIVPVGLREALLILGEGDIDPDQGARILGLISEAATRFSQGSKRPIVPVAPCPFFGERAARRFAWLDHRARHQAGAEQRWLFAEAEWNAKEAPAAYTADLRLSPVAGIASGRHEAEALRTLTAGALGFTRLPGLRDLTEETPFLSAWRRFEVLRRATSGEVVLELFPFTPSTGPVPLRPLP